MRTPLTSASRGALRVWLWSGLTAVVLGLVAVAADALPTGAGRVLIIVASTGLSWAVAAVAWGALSPTPASAAVSGLVVLVGAVSTYYVAIGAFSLRETITSALIATGTVWAGVGAVAGPVCGWLGWLAKNGQARSRSLAMGTLGGILMAQGVFVAWSAAAVGEFPPHLVLFLVVTLAVPLIAVVALCPRRELAYAFSAMVAVAGIGGLAWSGVAGRV